jgi:translation initiation factor IF-2
MMVNVSALKHEGIDQLLESIIVLAEIMELKANPNRKAVGTVIEAKLDKGRGPVASVLVHKGTLNIGDIMIVGRTFGKVRAMIDDKGRRLKKAGPSTPVEVVGLNDVPDSSDTFFVVDDERQARQLAETRASNQKLEEQQKSSRITLEDLFSQMTTGEVKDLNLILKADVHGSVEAIKSSLERLTTAEIRVNIIHTGVGAISETDVMLASASNAIIIGFNIRPDQNAAKEAELQNVDIRTYRIIYEIVDDVEAAMKGLLTPVMKESVIGHVEIREVFKISRVGSIAGCYVTDGKVTRNSIVRVIRDGTVVHEGPIESLRRIKDDVREVATGYECGIMLQRFNDIKIGDRFEIYVKEEVKRTEL